MKTLLFLRHAKSSWSDPSLNDHERPLNKRGRNAALLMGRFIAQNDLVPDQILCSTAVRARETLERATAGWGHTPPVSIEPALYDFSGTEGYLGLIRAANDEAASLMIIGHNPTIEILVDHLVGQATARLAEKLAEKYPTAALAVLQFDTSTWDEITPGQGHLISFTLPRELEP